MNLIGKILPLIISPKTYLFIWV